MTNLITKSIKMDLIETGKRGVTNQQMLKAFESNLTTEQLIVLALDYKEVFKSSVKYTQSKMKAKLEKIVQMYIDPSFTYKEEKNTLKEDNVSELRAKNSNTESIAMDLIDFGKRGITNQQMLRAFEYNLTNAELIRLALDYPEVFKSSIKYTSDSMKVKLEKIVQTYIDPSFTVKTGKKIKNALKEKTNIIILSSYKNRNNEKMSKVIKGFNSLSNDEKTLVKQMVEQDLGITELAKLHGLTKDKAYNMIFRNKNSIYNRLSLAN